MADLFHGAGALSHPLLNRDIRSPLHFGAMSIGTAWSEFMGTMDKAAAFKLLYAYYDASGNFLDTSNNYQNEKSETWVREWMSQRDNRDQIVVATKFTTDYRAYSLGKGKTPNSCGNHKRSLLMSVRDLLKKLQTDWIDILYLHWWDHSPIGLCHNDFERCRHPYKQKIELIY
ncbi:NADP-dependent oxidoreductase domain-containing protein [Lipomyces kononenkoae]